jgi:hypothetical protein
MVRRIVVPARCRAVALGETLVFNPADRPNHPGPGPRRLAHSATDGSLPPAQAADPGAAVAPLADLVAAILLEAGFPSLLVERGRVVLSGFVVTADTEDRIVLHWSGTREVNTLSYRRTFLGAYASVLRRAGLAVAYVAGDGEPYLRCEAGPSSG